MGELGHKDSFKVVIKSQNSASYGFFYEIVNKIGLKMVSSLRFKISDVKYKNFDKKIIYF